MRGVIMSVEGSKAVVLTKSGDFKQIKNKNYNIGDKVKVTTNYAARIGTIAAALAVFAIGGASYFMPASYVSVDINPSFLMTLNVYNKVIAVEPLNGEAENLLKKADVKGMNINDTVDTLIAESERIGYINENGGEVMVSVVPRMRTPKIEDKNKSDNINVIVSEAGKKELDEAKKMGVSVAKAKAIEEYTDAFGGTVPANAGKLGGMTIGQIRNEIDEKKEPQSTPAPTITPSEPSMVRVTENKAPQDNSQISLQSAGTPAPALGTPKLFAETPAPKRDNTANEKNENKPEEVRREDTKPQNADTPKPQPSEKEIRETKAPELPATPELPAAPDASERENKPAASGNQNTKSDVPQKPKPKENADEPARDIGGTQPAENAQKEQPKDNAPSPDRGQSIQEPAPADNKAPQGNTAPQNNTSPQSNAPQNNPPANNGGSAPGGNNPPPNSGNNGGSPSNGGAPSNGGGAPG